MLDICCVWQLNAFGKKRAVFHHRMELSIFSTYIYMLLFQLCNEVLIVLLATEIRCQMGLTGGDPGSDIF